MLQRLSFSLRDAVLGLGTINRLPCLCSSQETLLSQCLPTPRKTGVLNVYLQLWNGVGCVASFIRILAWIDFSACFIYNLLRLTCQSFLFIQAWLEYLARPA